MMQSWLNGRERSHDLKGLDIWEFHSESSSIMADLVQFDYESKGVGLTPMNQQNNNCSISSGTWRRFAPYNGEKWQVRKFMAAMKREVFIANENKKCTYGCLSCWRSRFTIEWWWWFSGNIGCLVCMHFLLCLGFFFFVVSFGTV